MLQPFQVLKTVCNLCFFVDKPEVSVSSPEPVVEDQSVTIVCQSEARPTVSSVTWMKGQVVIRVVNRFSGGSVQTPSLTIYPVARTDVGDYTCQMSNDVGHSSKSIQLRVWCKYLISVILIVSVVCQCWRCHKIEKP